MKKVTSPLCEQQKVLAALASKDTPLSAPIFPTLAEVTLEDKSCFVVKGENGYRAVLGKESVNCPAQDTRVGDKGKLTWVDELPFFEKEASNGN